MEVAAVEEGSSQPEAQDSKAAAKKVESRAAGWGWVGAGWVIVEEGWGEETVAAKGVAKLAEAAMEPPQPQQRLPRGWLTRP